jgi:hypothetical protein
MVKNILVRWWNLIQEKDFIRLINVEIISISKTLKDGEIFHMRKMNIFSTMVVFLTPSQKWIVIYANTVQVLWMEKLNVIMFGRDGK